MRVIYPAAQSWGWVYRPDHRTLLMDAVLTDPEVLHELEDFANDQT